MTTNWWRLMCADAITANWWRICKETKAVMQMENQENTAPIGRSTRSQQHRWNQQWLQNLFLAYIMKNTIHPLHVRKTLLCWTQLSDPWNHWLNILLAIILCCPCSISLSWFVSQLSQSYFHLTSAQWSLNILSWHRHFWMMHDAVFWPSADLSSDLMAKSNQIHLLWFLHRHIGHLLFLVHFIQSGWLQLESSGQKQVLLGTRDARTDQEVTTTCVICRSRKI